MRDTLVIVGSYTPTRKDFDFARTDCDIWVFNEAVSVDWCTRADAVFQLHDEVIWRNPGNRNDPNHAYWLTNTSGICHICNGQGKVNDKPCPKCVKGIFTPPVNRLDTTVYMQTESIDVPNSKAYPLQGILDMLGSSDVHFLTSSVSQALALAAYLGCYKRVEMYGVGMQTQTEYQYQREGVAHWLGYLRGLGIQVSFAGETYHAPVYGFEGAVTIDYHRFDERIAELAPQIDEHSKRFMAAQVNVGNAVKDLESLGSKSAQNNVLKVVQALLDIDIQLGQLDGAKQENERYKQKADVMRKTSDKFVFARQEFEGSAVQTQNKATQAKSEWISVATTLAHIERNALQAAHGSRRRTELFNLYRETLDDYIRRHNKMMLFEGASRENFEYMKYLDQHIRAAGGAKSEAVMLEAMQNA